MTRYCRTEARANKLWIPPDSSYNTNQDWLDNNYKKNTREEVLGTVSSITKQK